MNVGDLVSFVPHVGWAGTGIVLGIHKTIPHTALWVVVFWADHGKSRVQPHELVVVSESR